MKSLLKKLVMGVVVFVLVGGIGYFVYRQVTWEELDLSALAEYAETEDYDVLIGKVLAEPADPEGFHFVVLGDTRSNLAKARPVVSGAAAEKPVFILSNGDIVRRGRVEEYKSHHMQLVKMIAPLPFIPTPGNHERGPNRDFATFRAVYGGERFSFDYGDSRFIGFNNSDWNGVSGDDLAYLETELAKDGATHKFVIFHVPPRYLENHIHTEEGRGFTWNGKKFRALMAKYKVDDVFMGHIHGFATETMDGVQYTITGGGGANLAEELPPGGAVHNYVVIHVSPEGVRREVVKLIDEEWQREAF
jgi:predicted phosphodiesterase